MNKTRVWDSDYEHNIQMILFGLTERFSQDFYYEQLPPKSDYAWGIFTNDDVDEETALKILWFCYGADAFII